MAKRPPERYDPGELDRTRSNLGSVSEEEARRLSQLLGGEVGVERTAPDVESKYKKLEDLNRRRSDRIVHHTPRESDRSSGASTERRTPRTDYTRPRYRDRVRIDFLAARPEHAIKTLGGAFASLFSGLWSVPDTIHPRFIIDGDLIFFAHIENLVVSVRGLLSLNRKHPANRLRVPFYRSLLDVVKMWDVEGLHAELSRLQMSPRRVAFRYCGTLTRKLFRPLYRLIELDATFELRRALKRVYDLDLLSLPKTHSDVERVKRYYHEAVYEIEYVFGPLQYRLFPLLMKMCGSRFFPTDRFYFDAREEILAFLDLSEADLLMRPSRSTEEGSEPSEAEEAEVVDEENDPVLEAPRNQKGLEVLERLFPRAGWQRLDEFPDLYGHLQPVLSFPQGFELVRPDDPLQQVVALVAILHEMFYGFRHIHFGVLHESIGAELGERMHRAIEGWRVLHDEFIARSCLPKLREYCREVERNPTFHETEYGRRARDHLLWQKKQYLLPHLTVHRRNTPDLGTHVPKLPDLTSDLLELLSAVSLDVAGSNAQSIRSVRNPWDHFVFDIETPLIRRIKVVMERYREQPNNANLLLYAFSVLTLLDSLIREESSFYYPFPTEPIYRTESADSAVPLYTVPEVDTEALFREAERELPPPDAEPDTPEPASRDELTGLLTEHGLRDRFDTAVERLRAEKRPFSVAVIVPLGFERYCEEAGEEAGVETLQGMADVVRAEIREYRDVGARVETSRFAVLLPDTNRDEGLHFARRLIEACGREPRVRIPTAVGLFSSHRTWSRERAMRMTRGTAEAAERSAEGSIVTYNEQTNGFSPVEDGEA